MSSPKGIAKPSPRRATWPSGGAALFLACRFWTRTNSYESAHGRLVWPLGALHKAGKAWHGAWGVSPTWMACIQALTGDAATHQPPARPPARPADEFADSQARWSGSIPWEMLSWGIFRCGLAALDVLFQGCHQSLDEAEVVSRSGRDAPLRIRSTGQ